MKLNLSVKIATIALAFLASGARGACVAAPARPAGPGVADQLSQAENRFFFRVYTRDPIEKRLQRLELLVFGATQPGSNDERMARLRQTIVERDVKSRELTKSKAGAGPDKQAENGAGKRTQAQYPVLNTLEWRALKKTYPADSLDQRLERIETKLFGQSSPAMAYVDRVERLKRTLGVDIMQGNPSRGSGPLGPMPKARARMDDQSGAPPDLLMPFDGFPDSRFGFGMTPGLADVFKQMERQMEQLQKMPSGVWQWDPDSGNWVDPNTGRKLKPGHDVPDVPQLHPHPAKPSPAVPPYDDPNSI